MKVTIKKVFFDDKGLHRIGDIIDTDDFRPDLMDEFKEEKPKKKATKEEK
ncbi:MAG: hypothetical protein KBT03_05270 [Bacteroidales bacterium]|nr:hypothetical protein [Candidatus Scybalousia scybalohippi]